MSHFFSRCRMRAPARWLALFTLLTVACDPKPVAELPSISGKKEPDRTDRAIPGGPTIAAALDLLDPRGANTERLDRQRAEFESRVAALVPNKAERDGLGLPRLLRWHQLYTQRLREHRRALEGARKQAAGTLKPMRGRQVVIDDRGVVQSCPIPQEVAPTPPADNGPPAPAAAPKTARNCRPLQGFSQLDFQLKAAQDEMSSVLEAQWYLVQHLERLRRRLDPDAVAPLPETASP